MSDYYGTGYGSRVPREAPPAQPQFTIEDLLARILQGQYLDPEFAAQWQSLQGTTPDRYKEQNLENALSEQANYQNDQFGNILDVLGYQQDQSQFEQENALDQQQFALDQAAQQADILDPSLVGSQYLASAGADQVLADIQSGNYDQILTDIASMTGNVDEAGQPILYNPVGLQAMQWLTQNVQAPEDIQAQQNAAAGQTAMEALVNRFANDPQWATIALDALEMVEDPETFARSFQYGQTGDVLNDEEVKSRLLAAATTGGRGFQVGNTFSVGGNSAEEFAKNVEGRATRTFGIPEAVKGKGKVGQGMGPRVAPGPGRSTTPVPQAGPSRMPTLSGPYVPSNFPQGGFAGPSAATSGQASRTPWGRIAYLAQATSERLAKAPKKPKTPPSRTS